MRIISLISECYIVAFVLGPCLARAGDVQSELGTVHIESHELTFPKAITPWPASESNP